jgi:hypothetical protein
MRRKPDDVAEILARLDAAEKAIIEIGGLLEQLQMHAAERLREPLADLRRRHAPPEPSRAARIASLIGL